MGVIIPNQLKNENCRFVMLKDNLKRPLDIEWTTTNNFNWDSEEIQQHIQKGCNMGFLCGSDDIYVIDIDDKSLLNEFLEIVGETMVVETPKGFHIYFKFPTKLNKIILEKETNHLGELQAQGTQAVLPGSKNQNGEEYKIYKDVFID